MTGTVCVVQEEKIFEWKINDFLQLDDRNVVCYRSQEFTFSGSSWCLAVYPYGQERSQSVGYVGLRLYPVSLPKPLTVTMTLGIKTANEKYCLEATLTHFIDKEYKGFYRPKVLDRSDFIQDRSILLPSETLTVMCTIKNSEPNVVAERQFLNASVQTRKIAEHKLPDASTQTKEGTGIWKLQKHLHEISLNGEVSDIILKVEDQEFKSHRCILAARSPVFAAMMKNEMRENITGVVDIEDVDSKTFSIFLNYLYTGCVEDLTSENAAKLYTTADKYQVEELKDNCLDHMLVNVSVENFYDVFTISVQHNEEKLKETCFRYFGKHLLDIIQTCKWQSFASENPITANELHIKHIQMNKDFYLLLSNK